MVIRLKVQRLRCSPSTLATRGLDVSDPTYIDEVVDFQVGSGGEVVDADHVESFQDPDSNRVLFSVYSLVNGDRVVSCHRF